MNGANCRTIKVGIVSLAWNYLSLTSTCKEASSAALGTADL